MDAVAPSPFFRKHLGSSPFPFRGFRAVGLGFTDSMEDGIDALTVFVKNLTPNLEAMHTELKQIFNSA